MRREQNFPGFSLQEVNEQDNCVFFAVFEYVLDQYGVTLNRSDFEKFLKRKTSKGAKSGIEYLNIPSVIDSILRPYELKVDSILMQKGLKEHFLRRIRDEKLFDTIKMVLYLLDRRIVTKNSWTFPFIAQLGGESGMIHLEYVPGLSRFERVLTKVEGNQGRIPTGYQIGKRNRN